MRKVIAAFVAFVLLGGVVTVAHADTHRPLPESFDCLVERVWGNGETGEQHRETFRCADAQGREQYP